MLLGLGLSWIGMVRGVRACGLMRKCACMCGAVPCPALPWLVSSCCIAQVCSSHNPSLCRPHHWDPPNMANLHFYPHAHPTASPNRA